MGFGDEKTDAEEFRKINRRGMKNIPDASGEDHKAGN